jgi:hypothetical protein
VRALRLSLPLVLLAFFLASSSPAATSVPTGLHGFLLSADETPTQTFNRTPSFAWTPVSGAGHYEFQLATSSTFRENSVLWDDATLQTPVAAPQLTLPWITGAPHALFARVRALFVNGDMSSWSADYGFDVVPPAAPTSLPAPPGMLRWSQVDGADDYQVWLLDPGKIETVNTNVLDEREFYTFHNSLPWIGTVRWRVRAIRDDNIGAQNGMPAARYGPWSPVFTSTNPALADAPIQLQETISDVVSDGSAGSSAHELMPGFSWTGDETLTGTPAQLFRVYVFTDQQCLNPVFTSAVVGSPAYAPRVVGPLALPSSANDVAVAQNSYLPDGNETSDFMFDGQTISPTEQAAAASPTTSVPGGSKASLTVQGSPGAPVDLWDVDWPSSGYYWTVIPVQAVGLGGITVSGAGAVKGSEIVPVSSTHGFEIGDNVTIGTVPGADTGTVAGIGPGEIILSEPLANDHAAGVSVTMPIHYIDMEMPQDACAAGRVQRFGITSAPSLTTGEAPYATGLSSTGRLITSVKSGRFYGEPLVAWTPASGARAYEVQWSKKLYPFVAQTDPSTGDQGYLTLATSAILPLKPGTWWYRVRGFDFNLPTGSQQMAWSTPQRIVVAKPSFKVASAGKQTLRVVRHHRHKRHHKRRKH